MTRFAFVAAVLAVASASVATTPFAAQAVTVRTDRTIVQVAAPGPANCVATSAQDNAAAAQATNQQRRAQGLRPVKPNARLAGVAAAHACDMARRGLMAHRGTATKGPGQRVKAAGYRSALTAENIAAGPFGLGQVLAIWNASQGHLHNILIPQISEVGIGRAVSADGRTVFWAAVYAAPR